MVEWSYPTVTAVSGNHPSGPLAKPFTAAINAIIVHIVVSRSAVQPCCEEPEHLGPGVHRLLLPVQGRVVVHEPVSGPVVAVKLEVLAGRYQGLLVRVDRLRSGTLVVVAEQSEQRRRELLGVLDRRDRPGRRCV